MSGLLYAHQEIVVTPEVMRIGDRRYVVAELREVVKARGSVHPAVWVSLIIAAVEAGLILPLITTVGPELGLPIAVPAILIPCLVALVCANRWPPTWELWAWYRGARIRLFTTRDEQQFGQVSRAVMRAIEAATGEI